jgi:hypothetical protein
MSAHASPVQRLLIACHQARRDDAHAIGREHPGIVQGLTGADRRALTDEARASNAPAVELMLELGFDPAAESMSGPTGGTALHCAAWEGSIACTTALLRHPAGLALVAARDSTYGGIPLHWCCHGSEHTGNPQAGYAEVARLLLAAGADPAGITNGSEAVAAVIQQWRAAHPG